MFRRPSRAFEEGIAKGRNAILGLAGATPITGGLPIVVGGKIIGGVGVSGVTSDQDEQIASAGWRPEVAPPAAQAQTGPASAPFAFPGPRPSSRLDHRPSGPASLSLPLRPRRGRP